MPLASSAIATTSTPIPIGPRIEIVTDPVTVTSRGASGSTAMMTNVQSPGVASQRRCGVRPLVEVTQKVCRPGGAGVAEPSIGVVRAAPGQSICSITSIGALRRYASTIADGPTPMNIGRSLCSSVTSSTTEARRGSSGTSNWGRVIAVPAATMRVGGRPIEPSVPTSRAIASPAIVAHRPASTSTTPSTIRQRLPIRPSCQSGGRGRLTRPRPRGTPCA